MPCGEGGPSIPCAGVARGYVSGCSDDQEQCQYSEANDQSIRSSRSHSWTHFLRPSVNTSERLQKRRSRRTSISSTWYASASVRTVPILFRADVPADRGNAGRGASHDDGDEYAQGDRAAPNAYEEIIRGGWGLIVSYHCAYGPCFLNVPSQSYQLADTA